MGFGLSDWIVVYNWDFVVAVVVRGGGYDSVFVAAYRDAVGGGSDVDNDDLIELSLRWILGIFLPSIDRQQ